MGEELQAEDRSHRIGQPAAVNVYFLHVKQSADDLMWSLIQNKLENVGQVTPPPSHTHHPHPTPLFTPFALH